MPGDVRICCPHCDEPFSWSPDVADGRIRCRCGHVLCVPDAPDGELLILQDADDAPTARACPRCRTLCALGTPVCAECRYNFATGMTEPDEDEQLKPEPMEQYYRSWRGRALLWVQWQIPAAIVVIGVLAWAICGLIFVPWSMVPHSLAGFLFVVVVQVVWGMVALATLEFVTKADFGPWWTQALKLASIGVFFYWCDVLMYVAFDARLALFGSFLLSVVLGISLVRWFFTLSWGWTFAVILALGCCHGGSGSLFHPAS